MTNAQYFIEPLDVLFLRGNKLFGEPGSHGESLVPPWPSVAAGAIRSALLAHRGHDARRFAEGSISDEELGTPAEPGTFALTRFQPARRDRGGAVEPLFALPADLTVIRTDDGPSPRVVRPCTAPGGILSSASTPELAVLAEPERGKPLPGYWMTRCGYAAHLRGHAAAPTHLVPAQDLWATETRVGIGLDPNRRRAGDGRLFAAEAVSFRKREHGAGFDAGLLAEVAGATLPDLLMLRFGGDGRAALATRAAIDWPGIEYETLCRAGRCRLLLTAPGLFPGGWLPTGMRRTSTGIRFDLAGVRGRLVCASTRSAETISGFDLAARRPKPAQRAVPPGSVYWLDELQASPEALRNLVDRGLWSDPPEDRQRRAEGFNRCAFAQF